MLDEEAFEPTVTLSQSIEDTAISLIPEQQQVLELITHLTLYSSMLVAVSGPHGSGKTTLAYQLLHSNKNPDDVVVMNATIMLGVPAILRRVGDLVQQPIPENRSVAIELLKLQAQQRAELGRSLVIVIDQAEQLDTETLNELAEIALQIPQGLSIVLFGLSGYENNIGSGPNQAPVHVQQLQPLSEHGAQQLLQQVYSPGQPLPLSEEEFTAVYRKSQGVVGALLLQAGDLFLATTDKKPAAALRKKLASKSKIAEHFPITHVLALLFLLFALLLSYFYKPSGDDTGLAKGEQTQPVDVLRGLPLPEKSSTEDFNFSEELDENNAAAEISLPQISAIDDPSDTAEVTAKPVETKPKAVEPSTMAEKEQPRTQIQKTEKTSAATVAPLDKQKLMGIQQGFVIQLFGSYEQANANKFKQDWQQQLNSSLYVYETKNKNKAWFVVVAGAYPDKNTASQAIKNWPAELQKASPWIRDIKTVQQSLR